MVKDRIREQLTFEDLTEEEKQKRGILGRLYGPCASIAIPTRNGRFYNEDLWNYQFNNNDILKEMINNGGIPMELDHPTDREETCSEKIAAMMPELPKKDKDGHLICYCDIIDTPCGRIAYQLAKYGFKLGISSRGTGDLIQDDEGNESVDPETYDLTTFDLVLIPAVEDARLTMVEGLSKEPKERMSQLKTALKESLESASEHDKRIMNEALNNLHIDINNDEVKENKSEKAKDNGVNELISNLQESLKTNAELNNKVRELQNKLAVRDSEVDKLNEEVNRYKSTASVLGTKLRDSQKLSDKVTSLNEELDKKNNELSSLKEKFDKYISSSRETRKNQSQSLKESIDKKDSEVKKLNESLNTLNESIKKKDSEIKALNEAINEMKADSELKNSEYKKKIGKASKIVENYKTMCSSAIDRYIGLKADYLGVSSKEIKNRLAEQYTLEDIDSICESLQQYQLNTSRLPINIERGKTARIGIKQTVNESRIANPKMDVDNVDDDLLSLAGID